jgi:hypothetical protein
MLGNSQAVKNYFEQSGVQIRPLVSAEWNYNLLYQPYVTYSGTGQNLYAPLGDWSRIDSPKVIITTNQGGKSGAAFTDRTVKRFTVNATDLKSTDNFEGKVSLGLGNLPLGANCYKVIFYVRSIDTNLINLSTQLINVPAKVYSSTFETIDNFDWQKIELTVGAKKDDPLSTYRDLSLTLDFVNTTLNKLGPWGIEVCNIEVYQITYFDYTYGNMWPTNSAFMYFRPGESYVNSGNINIPDTTRKITKFNTTWDTTTPCSPVVYSPRTLFSANSNPVYKNGNLSPYSQYKYFVSERPNGKAVSIGASYENLIDVNKIVLKFNISQSIPNGTVVLYNGPTPVATISVSSNQISKSGTCILYYHPEATVVNQKWTTTKWSWSENNTSTMPQINKDGGITISQKINKIVFTQSSATPISGYQTATYNKSNKTEVLAEFSRLQVIEISPRLELDLSTFVIDYTVTKELDNKGTPLPISAMSANGANISLSNIPLSGDANIPLSVFSTNANNAALFISPLKNLLVKNVKFYLNYYIPQARINEPSTANRIIPGGVFYADTWDSIDIKVTKVNCFDIMKFLQTIPVNDYVSQSQNLVNIFTNLMDFAGFTDYDYDELSAALTDSNQTLNTSYFFADSKQKTVYDILREAFLAYQIGATIDENGILRFTNLQKIITNNVVTYAVNDENIVVNSYTETIKSKIGKIIMRYRMPQIKTNITTLSNAKDIISVLQQAPNPIWEEKSEDVVPYNYLGASINSPSQNYYEINKQDLNELFYGMPFEHNNYGVIEGEIISTGDKEVLMTDLNTSASKKYGVENSNELNAAVAEFSNDYKTANIQQSFTGRFLNVQRGLFGTPSGQHKVMVTDSDFGQKLQYATIDSNIIYTQNNMPNYMSLQNNLSIEKTSGSIAVPVSPEKYSFVYPKNEPDNYYNTYSVKFKFPTIKSPIEAGLMFNVATSFSQTLTEDFYQIGIKATEKSAYTLEMYRVSTGGSRGLIFSKKITHIINAIFNNEPKSPTFTNRQSKFINLKFVWQEDQILVFINDFMVTVTPESAGQALLASQAKNKKGGYGTKFGFYTSTPTQTSSKVNLAEIYACQSILDDTPKYHFGSQRYLDAIVADKRINEKFVMIQSCPQIFGLNIYDVQNEFTPSLGAEAFKVQYNLYYNENKGTSIKSSFLTVPESALCYSTILNSGFRSKFAILNNSYFTVFTKTSSSYSKKVNSTLAMFSRTFIGLTEQQTVERVLNPQNANEVIELQSDWLQSKKAANAIMGVVARASDDFSKDITVTLFGNPLLEVGDVVSLKHDLKNIKGLTFFVQSVRNTFSQGLTTEVVLNQIGYTGTGSESQKKAYPPGSNIPSYNNILGISPAVGSTAGGQTITIGGGINFSSSNPPQVYFDGTYLATNVVVLNSSTLTCRTPAHSAGFVNVKVISGGVTYQTINYESYEYRGNDVVLDPINAVFEVSNGANATTGRYEVALDWISTDPLENAFRYTLSNGKSGTILYDDTPILYKILLGDLDKDKTYTGTITTLYILNGAEIGKSDPVTFSFTTGSTNTNPEITPVITASAIKDASNNVTFKITTTQGIADTYFWKFYNPSEAKPDSVHQQSSGLFTATNAIYGLANGWRIVMYAKNGTLVSNEVEIYYSTIQLKDSFDPLAGVPATPNIRTITYATEGGNLSSARVYVTQDTSATKPTSYTFRLTPSRYSVYGSEDIKFTSDQFGSVVNGEYNFLISGLINGTDYKAELFGSNSKGNSQIVTRNLNASAGGYKVTNVSLSGNLIASWTSDPYFDSYRVTYYTDTNVVMMATANITKVGTVWKRSTGSNISSNGITFTDNYNDGQKLWASGKKLYVEVVPIKNDVAGTPAKSAIYTIPSSGSSFGTTAPFVYSQNKHQYVPSGTQYSAPGGSFFWYNNGLTPTGDYTSWVWKWEVYYNKTSASGTPDLTGTRSPSNPHIPSNSRFYVDVPVVGTHFCRVTMLVTKIPQAPVEGKWGVKKDKFT